MATAAATAVFSTPQARKRRSRKNRGRYCDHIRGDGTVENSRHASPNANGSLGHDGSYLTLSVSEMVIDANSPSENADHVVTLGWRIAEDVNPLDWIGLYVVGKWIFDKFLINSKIFDKL